MIVASANGRRAMRRSLLVSTALSTVLLASVGTAIAGDLEVSTVLADPISTSVGDGGGAGDINITTSGGVTLDAADGAVAAVTLDSAAESISNLGTIIAGAGPTEGDNLGQNGILVTTDTTGGRAASATASAAVVLFRRLPRRQTLMRCSFRKTVRPLPLMWSTAPILTSITAL